MPIGNPFLVTWSRNDQTGRLFELVDGVFVQANTFSVPQGSDFSTNPYIEFNYASDAFGIISHPGSLAAGTFRAQAYDLTGAPIGAASDLAVGAGVDDMRILSGFQAGKGFLVVSTVQSANLWWEKSTPKRLTISAGPFNLSGVWADYLTPDALRYVNLKTSGGSNIQVGTADKDAGYPTITAWAAKTWRFLKTVFSRDGQNYYTTRNTTPNTIELWGSAATAQYIVPALGIGDIQCFAPDRRNRFLAVGHDDGTTKTTVIFMRIGTILAEVARFPGMGSQLSWTADGEYLIDARNKKALRYEGNSQWTDVSATVMANVPLNSVAQAVSDHASVLLIDSVLYAAAVDQFAQKNVGTMKVALIDKNYHLDTQETTPANALAHEVSGGNWPAGGVQLQNVAYVAGNGSSLLKADDVKVALTQALTFAGLLLYDTTNNKPLVFVSYGGDDVTVDSNLQLQLKYSLGIVQFAG